jgi:nitrate/nitrite transport system permease protein
MTSLAMVNRDQLAAAAVPPPAGASHPAAPALTQSAARAASRLPAAATRHRRTQVPDGAREVIAYVLGLVIFGVIWAAVAKISGSIPGPAKVWAAAVHIFSDPFYQKGPNDQGIGWNVLSSLKRVGIGFGMAALVGIPLGFIIGRFKFLSDMAALLFKAANPAAIYVIFICSLWPMIINTAVGVQQVPQDYLNVARVLKLSEWKVFTTILFPAVLPYMITGVRLSIGVAWLVIVAAEMLTGGVGIGFWVWDEWNNLKVDHIIIAIITIGIIGLLLEQALVLLAKKFSYQ